MISYQSDDVEQMLQNVNSNMASELRRVLDRDFLQLNTGINLRDDSNDFSQHCYFNR